MATYLPTATPSRFGDWRIALKSILGFWLFYAATVAARAFLGSDPLTILENKLVVIVLGILLTGLIYASINAFAGNGTIRKKAVVAGLSSVVASTALAFILLQLEDTMRESKEEFRYQAREGFVVVEKGQQIRIERSAAEPLVLTFPKIHDLDANKRLRYGADVAVIWLFFFLAWSAFYLATRAQAASLAAQKQLAAAEGAAQAAQVRALRYQVNPHFLFNTLNSLSSLVMTGRTDRAEAMLLALSTFFRTSLSLDPGADVTLAEEIDLQRLYLDIEMARFPDRLNVDIDVPPELERALLPALILQPIVENAIKYGVSKSRKTVIIAITAQDLGSGRMVLNITNRLKHGGKDELPAATHEGTGLGIANVCQRLEARFGSAAKCEFGATADGGYRVYLTLPLDRSDG